MSLLLRRAFPATRWRENGQIGNLGTPNPAIPRLPLDVPGASSSALGSPLLRGTSFSLTATCNKPSSAAEGDLLLAWSTTAGEGAGASNPTDFATLVGPILQDVTNVVHWKIAGASEGSSYTFTGASSVTMIAIKAGSFDAADPFNNNPSSDHAISTAPNGPTTTTDNANSLLLWACSHQNAVTPPPTIALIAGTATGEADWFSRRFDRAEATGAFTGSMSSGSWSVAMFAVNPATGGATYHAGAMRAVQMGALQGAAQRIAAGQARWTQGGSVKAGANAQRDGSFRAMQSGAAKATGIKLAQGALKAVQTASVAAGASSARAGALLSAQFGSARASATRIAAGAVLATQTASSKASAARLAAGAVRAVQSQSQVAAAVKIAAGETRWAQSQILQAAGTLIAAGGTVFQGALAASQSAIFTAAATAVRAAFNGAVYIYPFRRRTRR